MIYLKWNAICDKLNTSQFERIRMSDNKIIEKLNTVKPREISGSRTINAYNFQLDICAYLILQMLQTEKDFITFVDYLDDIVILDDKVNPTSIIFYQVKSSKDEISVSQIISNSWLSYMETNLSQFKGVDANSIFLTNAPIAFKKKGLKISKDYSFDDYAVVKLNQYLAIDCTKEDKILIEKRIKDNLSDSNNYDNLYICRTKFTLADHQNQLLAELTNYLQGIDSRLDLAALKSIYDGFIAKLRSLGQETYNPTTIIYDDLKVKKGFAKTDLFNIYQRIKSIMIPVDFNQIYDFAKVTLGYAFKKNYLTLKDEYRDFGLYAHKNPASYNLVLNRISKIDVSTCDTTSLFDTIYNELSSDSSVCKLEFFEKYYEYIIIVYIYKV